MDEENEDNGQDFEAILKPYKEAILTIATQVQSQGQQIEQLNDLLINQVIGGIKNIHDASVREEGISGLKTKYGEQVSPFEPAMKAMYGDNYDWASDLHDHLTKSGIGPDQEADHVGGIIKSFQDKLGAITSAAGPKPVATEVEIDKEPVTEEEKPDELLSSLKALKKRGSMHFNK